MNANEGNQYEDDSERNKKQSPPPIESQNARINNPTSGNQCDKKKNNWPQRVEAVCAVMLVIITGFYTYYAAGQLHKLRRSVVAAEGANRIAGDNLAIIQRQFRMEERPYLSPVARGGTTVGDKIAVVVVDEKTRIATLAAAVDLHTVGKSPAIDTITTRTEYKIGPRDAIRQEVRNYACKYSQDSTVSIITMNDSLTPESGVRQFTKQEWDGIQDGTWEFYMVGGVRYQDIFSPVIEPYETTYCFQFSPKGMPFHICPFKPPAFNNSIK